MSMRHGPASSSVGAKAGPRRQRLEMIDALRGAALFGVLLVNMLGFAGFDNTLDASRTAALISGRWEVLADTLIDLFVYAKAIGIFTFLFGMGFFLQMDSLRARLSSSARQTYSRRLLGLLLLGLVHWALWSGEILHIYAIAGFMLLAVERWGTRALVIAGLCLAVVARPVLGRLLAYATSGDVAFAGMGDEQLEQRFVVFTHGSFADVISLQIVEDCFPQIVTFSWLAAVVHALGRFMVGLAVAREEWLQKVNRHVPAFLLIAVLGAVVGLFAERDWIVRDALRSGGLVTSAEWLDVLSHLSNSIGVTALTAAYVAAFALAWQWIPSKRLLEFLSPIGRTALTNYLLQTPVCYLLFCGFGLGLMGQVGPFGCLWISALIFICQTVLSGVWLRHFQMGPVEWLWRWWTYGTRPPFRITH